MTEPRWLPKDLILAVKAHTNAVSQAAVMVEDYK